MLGCCGCESLVSEISMRLSTTSRTVCGAVVGRAPVDTDTDTAGLHTDVTADDDTALDRDVGGTICWVINSL